MSNDNTLIPTFWKGVIVVSLIFMVVFSTVTYFWFGPQIFMQNRQAGSDIVESEMNADAALDNYEWFKQQEQDIIAKRNQMDNTQAQIDQFHDMYSDDPNEWSRTAETRHGRLHQQLLGQQNMHNSMVADYNARSNMENRAAFKDRLPYEMEKKFYVGDAR